jgi:hypothetical protein
MNRVDFRHMTVNERLYHTNQIETFDKAVEHRDENAIIEILSSIDVPQESIDLMIRNVRQFGLAYDPTIGSTG